MSKNSVRVSKEEMDIQKSFIEQIKNLNAPFDYKFSVVTFGCQMSESDGEKIGGMLTEMGYETTDDVREADVVVFNTCCVREHAEEKIFSKLGQLKNIKSPKKNMIIAFGGCMAQQPHVVEKIKKSYRYVDIVFGTHNVHRFPELLFHALHSSRMVAEVLDIDGVISEGLPVLRKEGMKAWVNIMYGCNNFCSYCIVPYVRGRERSRDPQDIIEEIETLAKQGYKEITLLGQNVNSYGLDKKDGSWSLASGHWQKANSQQPTANSEVPAFPDLLRMVNKIKGIERIRFMTSHPKDFSDDLIKAIAECEKVCEHIHIPFQSGSTRILGKMNRMYTKEQYLNLIEKIRKAIPGVSFTSDIIVGFPGETDEDFEDTLNVVNKVRFDLVYTFLYSKRKGTPAAEMPEQVDEATKKERFERLLNTVYKILEENNEAEVGKTQEVLVEEVSKNDDNILTGRTRTNRIVNFPGDRSLIGRLVNVKIVSQHMWYLAGELEQCTMNN